MLSLPIFLLVTWRSLEVLGYTPRILDHLTPVECLYANQVMSQPFKVLANSTDALECFAKRSKAQKKNQWQGSSRPLLKGQGSGPLPQVQGGAGDANQQKRGRPDVMVSSF